MEEDTSQITVEDATSARQFNERLRTQLPVAHSLAKALHGLGMLPGLRGATITDPATAQARDAALDHKRVTPSISTASVEASLRKWYADAGLKYPHGGR